MDNPTQAGWSAVAPWTENPTENSATDYQQSCDQPPAAKFLVKDGVIHWGPVQAYPHDSPLSHTHLETVARFSQPQINRFTHAITGIDERDRLRICAMDATTAYIMRGRGLSFHLDFDDATHDRLMTSLLGVIDFVITSSFDPETYALTYEKIQSELSPERILISCAEKVESDIYEVIRTLTAYEEFNICQTYVPRGQEVYMHYGTFVQGLAHEYIKDLIASGLITFEAVGNGFTQHYQHHSLHVNACYVTMVVHSG